MKFDGIGRIEELETDERGQPRRMVVSAVVAGTPLMLTLDVILTTSLVQAKEQDMNISVVMSQ